MIDTAGVALPGVNVRLTTVLDTALVITDGGGNYRFTDIIGPEFRLTFSMIGYKILDKSYPSNFPGPVVQLLPTVLPPQQTLLKEIVINRIQPIVIKEDTVQYNMDAFNVRQNSLLEEALKLLPNVQVRRDGTVIAHGKQISRVQVDSKNFFGGEVLTATRNLPAEFIQSIQVIDYYGDMANSTGIKDSEPEKILNIVLKEDKKRILFGQVTGGGGTVDRYIGSMGINNFNDGQEFSVLGSLNNTNTSLFSYGAPTGSGGRERGNSDLTGMVDPEDGINTTNSVGISYSDDVSDKVSVYGKYTFTNRKNRTLGNSEETSNLGTFSIVTLKDNEINTDNKNHLMAWDIEAQLDDRNYLKISPNISYSSVGSRHVSNDTIQRGLERTITDRDYLAEENVSTPNFDMDVLYSRAFHKPGRKFVVNMQGKYAQRDKEENISDAFRNVNILTGEPVTGVNDYDLRQDVTSDNQNRVGRLKASYVEPVDNNSILEFSYEYNYTAIDSRRSVWDVDKQEPVDSLSVDYSYFFESNRMGLVYQMEQSKRFKYTLGFAVQPLLLRGQTMDIDTMTQHRNVNLIPSAGFRFRINDESEWSIEYLGTNNQPNFSQIQPIRDVTNSQNIIIGNAELKAEFVNRITTRFRQTKLGKNRFFEAQLALNQVQNKIVTNRSNPSGTVQETSFRNTSGYFDARGYYMYSTAIFNDNFQFNLNGTTDYVNNVSYVNDKKNFGRNFIYSQAMQMRFMLEDVIETELNTSYTFNRTRYSLHQPYGLVNGINANSFLVGLAGKGYLSDNWAFGFDLSHRLNSGYSDFVSVNPTLLNAYIECTFLNNNMALLRLQGFDLFNQNTGITREVFETNILDVRNNRLARYFMLSLNIRLQKYPEKKR
ncbi:Outer membrane protein beta-barrel family protein [Parapedobacter indicus]|uniref:Outer membrane protein beta-barrel family protein n=1 Tax=Parapedobacter indicus TaxID=1477437 RepID=A0A1I3DCB4_9SPHI|nr:outer membrane beta-barrel protein [Parapedobacter indicus]SFH84410.1 Outer membrane protein beta-barrel family protein [Parapedobacter indicus]